MTDCLFLYMCVCLCVCKFVCFFLFFMVVSFQFSYSLKVADLHSNTLGRSTEGTSMQSFCNICKPTYSEAAVRRLFPTVSSSMTVVVSKKEEAGEDIYNQSSQFHNSCDNIVS